MEREKEKWKGWIEFKGGGVEEGEKKEEVEISEMKEEKEIDEN